MWKQFNEKKQITAPLGQQSQDSNIIIQSQSDHGALHECAAMTVILPDSQPHLGSTTINVSAGDR